MSTETTRASSPLKTGAGGYAMLALDQRESLRGMFPRSADGNWADDAALREFKRVVAEALTPHASAVLLDRPFAIGEQRPDWIAAGCGLIVAVDVLHQIPGQAVHDTSFDEVIDAEYLERVGADALKLLVMWRADRGRAERIALVERAIALAAESGTVSLIEAVVLPPEGGWRAPAQRHEAVLAAAAEIAPLGPDIYKAQVPGYTAGQLELIEAQSRELSRIVGGEWVVLSNGVERDDFADAVAAAMAGGASGFLAGRAIWADLVGTEPLGSTVERVAVPRLRDLRRRVDALLTGSATE